MIGDNINGFNVVFLQGKIQTLSLEDKDSDKPSLRILLVSFHSAKPVGGKVRYYKLHMPIVFFGRPALKLAQKFKVGDNILVEGKLRQHESGKYKLIGIHADFSDAVYRTISSDEILDDKGDE